MKRLINLICCVIVVTGTASYYDRESCQREGTSGIMANGEKLDDSKLTCATWKLPFGTRLRVTNMANAKSVEVVVTDSGPNKKLYNSGRIVDLSKAAFKKIADNRDGIIPIKLEVLNEDRGRSDNVRLHSLTKESKMATQKVHRE